MLSEYGANKAKSREIKIVAWYIHIHKQHYTVYSIHQHKHKHIESTIFTNT